MSVSESYGLKILGPGSLKPKGLAYAQEGDNRGFITFGPRNKVSISLLENANASTFVHEMGHLWLKMQTDLAKRPEASEQVRQDAGAVLKWLGLSDASQIQREHHERFAKAHEAYLREGRAPTSQLAETFARFRTWMKAIYKRLTGLDVKLSDDVRRVFDRIYTTDEEIQAAHRSIGGDRPLFSDAGQAGMNEAAFKIYQNLHNLEGEQAKATLDSSLRAQEDRTQLQWWKDELAKVKEEVSSSLDEKPEYKALSALLEGKDEAGIRMKLNKDALVSQFGEGVLKDLPRRGGKWVYSREGGMDAETASEILGFDSGTHLVETLKALPSKESVIQAQAESVMKARHGDLLSDGSIAEAAVQALHNQPRLDRLMMELESLRRKEQGSVQGRKDARETLRSIPNIQDFRTAARELVDQAPIRNLDPNRYLIASRKASREAFELMARERYGAAGDAKQREILNHHLYLEAAKAKQEAASTYRYGKEAQGERIQSLLGKAGISFQENFNQILDSVEFAKVTNKALDERRASLAAWVAEQEALGAPIVFDPSALPQKNWRELNRVELRAVQDALSNIEAIARATVNRVREGKTVEYNSIVEELESKTADRRTPLPKSGSTLGYGEKVKGAVQAWDANLKKMEWVIDKLDQADIDGPARALILDPVNKGQVAYEAIQHEVTQKIAAIVADRPELDRRSGLDSIGVKLPGFDRELSRRQAISLLFNMGTEENRNATLLGYKLISPEGVLVPELFEAFGKLRKSEIQYVQKVWDLLESFWQRDADFQHRMTGIQPERKTLTPFSVKSAEGETISLRGGYWPLVGSSEGRVNRMQEGMDLAQIFSEGYSAPSTSKSRFHKVSGAAYEVMLNHEYILTRHLDKMARDLAFREPAYQVAHALRDPRVSKAIQETVGLEYEKEMLTWLKDTVNGDQVSLQDKNDIFLSFLLKRRAGVAASALAFNLASAIKQVTDPLKALPILKEKSYYLASAFAKVRLNPEKWMNEIREMSPEVMRYREENFSREQRQIVESRSAAGKAREGYSAAGFAMLGAMDRFNSFPIWLALFDKAMDDTGGNRAKAIRIADRDANMVLQAGRVKDLSPLFRRKGYSQIFSLFQNEANTYYNLISGMVGRRDAAGVALAIFAASASNVIGKMLAGQAPDDPEKRKAWLIRNAALGPVETLPYISDAAKGLVDINSGGKADVQYSPFVAMFAKPAKASHSIGQAWGEEDEFKNWQAILDTADAAGTWFGIEGTTQFMKSGRYLNRVRAGEETPEDKLELARKTALGAPPKR